MHSVDTNNWVESLENVHCSTLGVASCRQSRFLPFNSPIYHALDLGDEVCMIGFVPGGIVSSLDVPLYHNPSKSSTNNVFKRLPSDPSSASGTEIAFLGSAEIPPATLTIQKASSDPSESTDAGTSSPSKLFEFPKSMSVKVRR